MDQSGELVQKASRGDAAAIGALIEEHLPRLQAFVRLRMGPELRAHEGSEDLVQSVCRELLQHLERYQYQGSNQFRGWLYTTALRKVSNRLRHLRAQRRDAARLEPIEEDGGPTSGDPLGALMESLASPSRQAELREEIERLERAFEALPDHYREVLTLSRLAGLSHREVAEQMGKTEGAARVLLFRALVALSKQLGEAGQDSRPAT